MRKGADHIFVVACIVMMTCGNFFAQSVDRSVTNSTGGSAAAGGVTFDFSIGEPVTVTGAAGTGYFTQGFIQPDTVFTSPGIFALNLFYASQSCVNQNDGYIIANAMNASGPVTWLWLPTGDTVSSLTNLAPGTYIVFANDTSGNSVQDTIVLTPSTAPCQLQVYNGVTPDNDGKNDKFIIANIDAYPSNSMFIFNRYGSKVWEGKDYDNLNVAFEGRDKNGSDLPAGTYFYILVLPDSQLKGWLEIIR